MRLALAVLLPVVACSDRSEPVDRGLVGTWELMVPNADGVARWVWDVHADGTYAFHAEGPGGVPAHSGEFQAGGGRYALRSTTMVWVDSGTYQLTQPKTLRATGILGTASWIRVSQGNARSAAILAFLTTQPFDTAMLAPFGNPRTESASFDAQAENDGVTGIVRTVVQSPDGPGAISVRVYRDWTSAQAAYAADALIDSPTFRLERGLEPGPPREQVINSVTVTHTKKDGEKRQGKCLSRVQVGGATAWVTCYLLVRDPTPEAVIIVGAFNEPRTGTKYDASSGAYERAVTLLAAGIGYWDISLLAMKAKGISR